MISEGGLCTAKFEACQRVIAQHVGQEIPKRATPADSSLSSPLTLSPRTVTLTDCCPLLHPQALSLLSSQRQSPESKSKSVTPRPIEYLGEGSGYVLYRHRAELGADGKTDLEVLAGKPLKVKDARDLALVLVDGQLLALPGLSTPRRTIPLGNSGDWTAGAKQLQVIVILVVVGSIAALQICAQASELYCQPDGLTATNARPGETPFLFDIPRTWL